MKYLSKMAAGNKQIPVNSNNNNSQINYLCLEIFHGGDSDDAFSGFEEPHVGK